MKHAAGRGRVKREAEATPLSPEDASPPPGHHAHARRHGGAGVKREDGGGGASASAPRPPSGGLRTFSRQVKFSCFRAEAVRLTFCR